MSRSTMPDLLRGRPTPSVPSAVASLHRLGVDPEHIEFIPVSPLESFKGTVVGQVPHPGTPLDSSSWVTLYLSMDGLTERLPHDFLEPLPTTEDEAHVAIEPGQVMDFWERQVTAYGPGRKFIKVIDRALARLERDLGRVESSFTPLSRDTSFAERVLRYLELDELPLDETECLFFCWKLQSLQEQVGPRDGITRILREYLSLPVRVELDEGEEVELPERDQAPLGSGTARLGGGIALGPGFRDPAPRVKVQLGPVSLAQHRALDSDPLWHRRVQSLLELCVPAENSSEYELVLREEERAAALGDSLRGRLGRSCYLTS